MRTLKENKRVTRGHVTPWVVYCVCVLGLLLVGPVGAVRAADERPNVVLILVDDMGWMDLSCQGSTFYETPNIDRLAKQGMRFTNAYAACAVCSPTRAAVMTGRYPARVGVTDWIRAKFQRGGIGTPKVNPTDYVRRGNQTLWCPPNPYWMEHSEVTLAEMLKPEGYQSCHIGKWHLGDDAWFPTGQGFDENHGGCDYGQPPSYFDPYQNKKLTQGIPFLKPRRTGEYLSDREAHEAVTFIEKNRDNPFFLYMAHYAVHTPIQAKADVTARYQAKAKTNQTNAKYAAMVESVDDSVGRIMATLDKHGLTENTLVILTSDNGGLDQKNNPTDNAPLRSGKGYPYEGGIRVPLIVQWSGIVPAGTLTDEPVTSVDYVPTILQATRAPSQAQAIDGESLLEALECESPSIAPHALLGSRTRRRGAQPVMSGFVSSHWPTLRLTLSFWRAKSCSGSAGCWTGAHCEPVL